MTLTLHPVLGVPEIEAGDDVGVRLGDALVDSGLAVMAGDVLAVAQKVVSKAEGCLVDLRTIAPSARALQVAELTAKDPRLVELILRESESISRMAPGVLIVRHRLGFTSANAGIDRSNVPQGSGEGEWVLLLPRDPDESAERLRLTLQERFCVPLGVVITDSHGRPFRLGTVGVAIGVAGIPALWDRRGEPDRQGYLLQHTDVGVADEIAAAAGLIMGQAAEGIPAVLIHGLRFDEPPGTAQDLIRPAERDLYR